MEAISTDVLPVGAGAAGIRAALAVFGGRCLRSYCSARLATILSKYSSRLAAFFTMPSAFLMSSRS